MMDIDKTQKILNWIGTDLPTLDIEEQMTINLALISMVKKVEPIYDRHHITIPASADF